MTAARIASLVLTGAALVFLVVEGRALGDSLSWTERTGLALLLAGSVGGFAHGAGIAASGAIVRFVAVPGFAWPAIVLGAAVMAATQVLS